MNRIEADLMVWIYAVKGIKKIAVWLAGVAALSCVLWFLF
jgi:hypothetical protein